MAVYCMYEQRERERNRERVVMVEWMRRELTLPWLVSLETALLF